MICPLFVDKLLFYFLLPGSSCQTAARRAIVPKGFEVEIEEAEGESMTFIFPVPEENIAPEMTTKIIEAFKAEKEALHQLSACITVGCNLHITQ
ncbi:hypothetical protein [Laspinema olomoucense]|uniref:hypothetical protein n=1 Tax=Laspinema olomoucense TaxID=3231600 RepID=UPI0021BADCFC|nr:hypothetical protein [Laspinema sp. D3d]MCT7971305.1 hypothetical protein [Laspinema sp. D3d]